MFYLYLFGAIVGGTLLIASLLGGGHHGHLANLGHHLGIGGHHGDGDAAHHHDSSSAQRAALQIFSLQLWTWLLGFGGLTGLLLQRYAGTPEPICALLAGSVGLGAGIAAR